MRTGKNSTGYSDGHKTAARPLVLQRPLLLRELYNLFIYEHTLSFADRIHVRLGNVNTTRLLAEVFTQDSEDVPSSYLTHRDLEPESEPPIIVNEGLRSVIPTLSNEE